MISLVLAAALVLTPSVSEQMKQFDDTAADSRKLVDHYREQHDRDDQIRALHDIEDAIIFDSLEDGDD